VKKTLAAPLTPRLIASGAGPGEFYHFSGHLPSPATSPDRLGRCWPTARTPARQRLRSLPRACGRVLTHRRTPSLGMGGRLRVREAARLR